MFKFIFITIILLAIIFLITISLSINYTQAISNFMYFSMFFIFVIFICICIILIKDHDKEDINLIIKSIKIYASIIGLMMTMIYLTTKDAILFQNEINKIKIENPINEEEKQKALKEYEQIFDFPIKLFLQNEAIDISKDNTNNEKKDDKDKIEIMFYINVASTIIIITGLLCFLDLVNNLTMFNKKTDKNKKVKRIRKRVLHIGNK